MNFSRKIQRFIDIAYAQCFKSDGNHQLGAVLVRGGKVVAKGYNSYTTGRHAEANCLAKTWANQRTGCTLFVARKRKTQKYGMAMPCPECNALIFASGIKKVYYTDNDSNIQCWSP